MRIKTWRKPNGLTVALTKPREIELEQGLTILTGCNGAGKSTLLLNIKEECEENNIPCYMFNNLSDGGRDSIGAILGGFTNFACDNISMAASLWTSSEGEAIKINIGRQSTLFKEFLRTGKFRDGNYRIHKAFRKLDRDYVEEEISDKRRVFLFDASDSGLSIDSVIEIKQLFNLIITDAKKLGLEIYIIVAANEYELCREEKCFDVNAGKYIRFEGYEDYRKFILTSREKKEKRLARDQENREKKKQKHYRGIINED